MGFRKVIKTFLIYLLTLVLAAAICAVGLVYIFEKGPSPALRDLFVTTVTQTSAAKFAATMFLDKETVAEILEPDTEPLEEVLTDTSLVSTVPEEKNEDFDINAVTIEDVRGGTYKGKMMIVNDPSRVYVYSIPNYEAEKGMQVQKMVKAENALAGINGGGFEDPNGMGQGAVPRGLVISKGVHRHGGLGEKGCVVGFDRDNKLIVGTMTGQEAKDAGIRDAVVWGPALIINGEAIDPGNTGGGINPRSAIGQRADGAVLLLVIEGRQPGSMGASYQDLIDIMLEYGAVNAGNLDGGTSSSMVYDGELITNVCSFFGERTIPTAILVERRDQ